MKMSKLPILKRPQIELSSAWKVWDSNPNNWARLIGTNIIFCYNNSYPKRFYWIGPSDPTLDKSTLDTPQMYFREAELQKGSDNGRFLMGPTEDYIEMLAKLPNHLSKLIESGIQELEEIKEPKSPEVSHLL